MMGRAGVSEALRRHPGLRLVPGVAALALAGTIEFFVRAAGHEAIRDRYEIKIIVPSGFPADVPRVWSTDGRVPRSFHRLEDESFCLGSPVRLRLLLGHTYTLADFIDRCIISYLYGVSHREQHGAMPFGELEHGSQGLLQDYEQLLDVAGHEAVVSMLILISLPRRVANKQPCPCGRGRRLGRCHHETVNEMRRRLRQRWCRGEAAHLIGYFQIDRDTFLSDRRRWRALRGHLTNRMRGRGRCSSSRQSRPRPTP